MELASDTAYLWNRTPQAKETRAIETAFCTWYGGFVSLATRLDPDAKLPPTQEMMGYVSQNIGRAQAAIAA